MYQNRWFILILIIFLYIPVSIDATILHIAIPTLSFTFSANSNQLLWVLDIYSLMMAGLLLPMGALGDRIGFRRIMLYGIVIFAVASLLAGMSRNIEMLIAARAFLALGAAMILPATLAGIRYLFVTAKERSTALAVWSTVGVAGAALGPLVGGYLLEHYYWGSVFLINLPIIAIAGFLFWKSVPTQAINDKQTWSMKKSLMFVMLLLLLVYGVKSTLRGGQFDPASLIMIAVALSLLIYFVRHELRSKIPIIDFDLFKNRIIVIGTLMALFAMVSMVGFELVMAQELQFVHDLSPLQASLFMLPMMLASGAGGFLANWLTAKSNLRWVGTGGVLLCTLGFIGLGMINITEERLLATVFLIILGVSISTALFASTAAIMSAVEKEKAASAGAIESMAYELGAGFGVVMFGMLLKLYFSSNIRLPEGLSATESKLASSSIPEALQLAQTLSTEGLQLQVIQAAKTAFISSHQSVLFFASGVLAILTVLTWTFLPKKI